MQFNINFIAEIINVHNINKYMKSELGNPLFQCATCKWTLIGTMLGCDYLVRIKKLGFTILF